MAELDAALKELLAQAAQEQDSEKLATLIAEINRLLDENQAQTSERMKRNA